MVQVVVVANCWCWLVGLMEAVVRVWYVAEPVVSVVVAKW